MFEPFAKIVAKAFQDIVKDDAFVVDIDGDVLFQKYLTAFPEGTNPIFKKNTEHDCSCCKQFIRRVGGVVSIEGEKLVTIWDRAADDAPGPYNTVASVLRDAVKGASVKDLFRVAENEASFGAFQTLSLDPETQETLRWNHFYTGGIPKSYRVASPDQVRGDRRTTVQVFERGLVELTPDAVETVLGLIEANNLYRGEEHKNAVVQFKKAQSAYRVAKNKNLFVWANAGNPAARFRNTVIGTLVQDLSEGKDLEHAVKSFETKVAPTNYKRTTALITPAMVKKAMETIEVLGLESALERRFATIADISVNDVKWVDGAVKPLMKGGIGDVLMAHATKGPAGKKDEERAEDISLDDFMRRILPETSSLEILFKNELVGNLVSLTAPVHPEPKQLFKWTNDFAWSYGGNVADSIKERVKRAGGKVDGAALRVSLSWFNYDDLDLHIIEPPGRGIRGAMGRIWFGGKQGWSGGTLDVDMNAGCGKTREAVENVVWMKAPPDGPYKVIVNNYCQRETADPGFVIEMECGGKLTHFTYNKGVRTQQDVTVATLYVKNGVVEQIEVGDPGITAGNVTQDKWGLKTEQYVKVSAVTLSPNYWGDNAVGNKHTFFLLEGAKNDEATRGFYNEFLHPRLEPHRKVFEVIGDKTKCQPSDQQLSGLGFSSTKKESFVVRAQQGKKRRVFNVHV
jgi:hypothetical protein